MKLLKLILALLVFGFTILVIAQENKTDCEIVKKNYFIDKHSNITTSVFRQNLNNNNNNTSRKSIDYLEFLK